MLAISLRAPKKKTICSSSPIQGPHFKSLVRSILTQTRAYLDQDKDVVNLSTLSRRPNWEAIVFNDSPSQISSGRLCNWIHMPAVDNLAKAGSKYGCQGASCRITPLIWSTNHQRGFAVLCHGSHNESRDMNHSKIPPPPQISSSGGDFPKNLPQREYWNRILAWDLALGSMNTKSKVVSFNLARTGQSTKGDGSLFWWIAAVISAHVGGDACPSLAMASEDVRLNTKDRRIQTRESRSEQSTTVASNYL